MEGKGPGKYFRKGITFKQILKQFPDDATAEQWFVERRWNGKPVCPHCGCENVKVGAQHKSMPFRCRRKECQKRFSVKTGTVMEGSKIGYQDWILATYLMSTSLKSISSMKLHRELGITQKSAWFLAHRLRAALDVQEGIFTGPVETDESYFGGKRKNMSNAKRRELKDQNTGRGTVGKTAVVGMKDRDTNKVRAQVVKNTDKETLQGFIVNHTDEDAQVYTDDALAYHGMPRKHDFVKHSAKEYVRDMVHTNGKESFWATLKRSHMGTFHKFSPKHLQRYVDEFSGRHNMRYLDTRDQIVYITDGMRGKRLRYVDLIRDNGLPSGARRNALDN